MIWIRWIVYTYFSLQSASPSPSPLLSRDPTSTCFPPAELQERFQTKAYNISANTRRHISTSLPERFEVLVALLQLSELPSKDVDSEHAIRLLEPPSVRLVLDDIRGRPGARHETDVRADEELEGGKPLGRGKKRVGSSTQEGLTPMLERKNAEIPAEIGPGSLTSSARDGTLTCLPSCIIISAGLGAFLSWRTARWTLDRIRTAP